MTGARASGPLLLLSANSVWNILNFRIELIQALQGAGYRIAVAAPEDDGRTQLEHLKIPFHPLPMRTTGLSLIRDAVSLGQYARLLRKLRPAAFLGFTAKPNTYGSLAARMFGVPVINNVTGLGTAFIGGGKLEAVLASLYRMAFRRSVRVFFHNDDDLELFVARDIVRRDQAEVLPGSGVDLDRFRPVEPPSNGAVTFLLPARLLWEKGVGEFVEAARMVKAKHSEARFQLLGGEAEGARGVRQDALREWVASGIVEYLGTSDDIRDQLAKCDCVVLPSYREGLPRVILEGAAMARPAIASDVPGCRHAIEDEETGYLCEVQSAQSLADAMERMITLGPKGRAEMGRRARARVEKKFSVELVNQAYRDALSAAGVAAP